MIILESLAFVAITALLGGVVAYIENLIKKNNNEEEERF